MSVTFILIPLALAAVADHKARKGAAEDGHHVVEIQTRMRDAELLEQTLTDLGWASELQGETIAATSGEGAVTFVMDEEGTLQARFAEGTQPEQAEAFLRELDAGYARRVQQAVYERLVGQAGAAGMVLESEHTDADESIVVTLRVED